jgi:hypothetical protein
VECAAAASSSGLVFPSARSVRDAQVTASSPAAPLPHPYRPGAAGQRAFPRGLRHPYRDGRECLLLRELIAFVSACLIVRGVAARDARRGVRVSWPPGGG